MEWDESSGTQRLWQRDSTLWRGGDEGEWLGWLGLPNDDTQTLGALATVSPGAQESPFSDVVLLGMGGSSLCPDVLRSTFGPQRGAPVLHVVDSTDSAYIRTVEERLDLGRSLFIVSSKSGTTLESSLLFDYFFDRVAAVGGSDQPAKQFVCVTDPGSALEKTAHAVGFRAVFHGVPDVGGRYAALSNFGLVAASAMGLEVGRLVASAMAMKERCAAGVRASQNPGTTLGLTLGVLAGFGRDKLTLSLSPSIAGLGAWVEQLVAESTGKDGMGLIPVDGEDLAPPERYGSDRIFVYVRDTGAPDRLQDIAMQRIVDAGHPVIRLGLVDRYDVGAEFFRWEFATAVVGARLGVNPFDQPDVESTKLETSRLMTSYEDGRSVAEVEPTANGVGLEIYVDPKDPPGRIGDETWRVGDEPDQPDVLDDVIGQFCARLRPRDYFAVLAYVEMSAEHIQSLQRLRHVVRDATGHATCVGFGPRFLHSTGQIHKGGPPNGLFLQITCAEEHDLAIPGRGYSFGVVKAAQATGDLSVLWARHRRALRIHITGDVGKGLTRIADATERAVAK